MNRSTIVAIVRRDLTVVARSRAVIFPLILLPVVFFVLLPALLSLAGGAIGNDLSAIRELLALMPEGFRRDLTGLSPAALFVVWGLEYVFATFFLLVPIMTSAVIAADSFAGEKERKTVEALVYTPTSDRELYAGKLLAPWLAAVVVSTVGYVVFVLVATLFGGAIVGRPIAVTPRWLLFVLVLAPGVAALGIGVLVHVSARVRGFQEAYQLGGLIVLPLVVVLVSQVSGVLYLDLSAVAVVAGFLWIAAAATLAVGYRSFRRERLLAYL
ncbi:MAG TPA: ABC transporter permease subunit [Vicinamibacterales bacterium]|nr:ABC transporter permease subunit [Vicinamibacterales bacterium]